MLYIKLTCFTIVCLVHCSFQVSGIHAKVYINSGVQREEQRGGT